MITNLTLGIVLFLKDIFQFIKIAVTCYASFTIIPISPISFHRDQNLSLDH